MSVSGYAPAFTRTRRSALLRGFTLLPGLLGLVVLRLACLLAWPFAAVWVLLVARAPRWWRRLAGRTLTRATRQRAHAWLLSDTRAGQSGPRVAVVPVEIPDLGPGIPRRSLLARVLLSPVYALGRWVLGTFALVSASIAWLCLVLARRHPAWVRRSQVRLLALCRDVDVYMLLLVPERPRLPEVDPRLATGDGALVDHPPLPPWSRRTGWLAVGVDFVCGIVVVGAVAGVFIGAGADLDTDAGVVLALDLLIQTLAPMMGLYLVASEAPITVAQLGLHVLRPWRSAGLAFGLIGGYAVLLLSLAVLAGVALLPLDGDTASDAGGLIPDGSGTGWTIVFVGLATVIAPVFEETFYRGIMFQALREHRGTWVAAVLSSFAFACAHLDFSPIALIDRSLIGVGLCYLFARTGRLLPGMFAHSINNAIVISLTIGWTWQVPIVVIVSLVLVLILASLPRKLGGSWDPFQVAARRVGVPILAASVPVEPPPSVGRLWSDE